MEKLSRKDLWSLEEYAERRSTFRSKVMAHKKNRQVSLDDHARLYFEDAITIKYQIQEMLRIERVFEAAGIQAELDAYNPLISDGSNWKATFMLEYEDPEERMLRLQQLIGIEDGVWAQVGGLDRVFAIADEDMPRDRVDKTASVHFLRFELTPDMIRELKGEATLAFGIDHSNYLIPGVVVDRDVRRSLVSDLDDIEPQV